MNKHTDTAHTTGTHTESHTHDVLWKSATAAAKALFRRSIEIIPGKVEHVSLTEMMKRESPGSMFKTGATEHGEYVFYPSGNGEATLAPICWEELSFNDFAGMRDTDGKVYTAVVRESGAATIRVVTMDLQRD